MDCKQYHTKQLSADYTYNFIVCMEIAWQEFVAMYAVYCNELGGKVVI